MARSALGPAEEYNGVSKGNTHSGDTASGGALFVCLVLLFRCSSSGSLGNATRGDVWFGSTHEVGEVDRDETIGTVEWYSSQLCTSVLMYVNGTWVLGSTSRRDFRCKCSWYSSRTHQRSLEGPTISMAPHNRKFVLTKKKPTKYNPNANGIATPPKDTIIV